MDYVRDAVAANPAAAQSPLIAGAAQRQLATCILAAYPNTSQSDPTTEDRRDSTPVLLRRATAFIDDNAHRDISLVDIARAVHVSPRAVQYMFRKHRNTTPMQYLRKARLHFAHLDLQGGDRATISVTEIARRWGFGHIGRFANSYREAYGQRPYVTLRG
jgi:AraC-like DNA-binding protein